MEAIIFIGVQATGNSTFYKERFFRSHVRISLDLLKTRNREDKMLQVCLETQQAFVVDNTNPAIEDRAKYINAAKARKYQVVGYYFKSKLNEALGRNSQRLGKENIPEVGIRGTYNKLRLPSMEEGFDRLYFVEIDNGTFVVKDWNNEV